MLSVILLVGITTIVMASVALVLAFLIDVAIELFDVFWRD